MKARDITAAEALAETRSALSQQQVSPVEITLPTLTILAHPDSARVGELATLPAMASEAGQALSRVVPEFGIQGETLTRPLADIHLSRKPILLHRDASGQVVVARGGCRTRIEIDSEALDEERRLPAEALERGVVLMLGRRVTLLLHLHPPVAIDAPDLGMIGESLAMIRLRRTVQAVADLEVPLLLRGESGTGKELLARAIHRLSPRCAGRYLAINVAAVPLSLAPAELFGAARGAYTGADRKREGFFQRADGGTLFLDEIGEISPELQPLLLRVLENGELQPVGGRDTRRVDVRVVAATDADLEARVAAGDFSRPLFHRLAGYEVWLPPLRERRADIGRLIYHFLRQELAGVGMANALDAGDSWPSAERVARLVARDWPGNVRELKNTARRMVIERRSGISSRGGGESGNVATEPPVAASGTTTSSTTSATPAEAAEPPPPGGGWRPVYRKPSEVSEDELLAALRSHRFELKAAAAALGVSRGTLYNLVAACPRVRKATDLERDEIVEALAASGGDLEAAAEALEVSLPGLKRRAHALGLG
ncbi:MAG: sigma 54-interacting transcriptional regulator [Acidobacteriota bacterium]